MRRRPPATRTLRLIRTAARHLAGAAIVLAAVASIRAGEAVPALPPPPSAVPDADGNGPARSASALAAGAAAAPTPGADTAPTPGATAAATPTATPTPRRLSFTGDLAARYQVKVFSRVAGVVLRLHFREGTIAKAGDVLAEIDPREYELNVAQNRANVAEAEAKLSAMIAGGRPEERTRAAADLAAETAVLVNAQEDLQRQDRMYAKGGVPRQAVDAAKRAVDVAKARTLAAQKALALVSQGPRQEERDAARAELSRAESALELAELQLSYCKVRAPFDGIVGQRLIDEGAFVLAASSPQAPAICIFSDASVLRALVDVPESDLLWLRLGEEAKIRVQAAPDQVYSGMTFNLFPYVDARTRTSKLEIEVPNQGGHLLVGMFVKAEVEAAGRPAQSIAQILERRPPDDALTRTSAPTTSPDPVPAPPGASPVPPPTPAASSVPHR